MKAGISQKVTWKYLLLFSLPNIASELVIGLHWLVDGFFVSRFIEPIALSAVGIVIPVFVLGMTMGFMLAIGGNALFAKKLGEGKVREAKENFTLLVLVTLLFSAAIAVLGFIFRRPLLYILGADESIYQMAHDYLIPILIFSPTISLGIVFMQTFLTEGKPHLATIASVVSGVSSIGLNFLFIYVLQMGLTGAAIATGIGNTIPCIIGIIYFSANRKGSLCFVVPKFDFSAIVQSFANGLSDMIQSLADVVTRTLVNNVLMRFGGASALAAFGVISAGFDILIGIPVGYIYGVSAIASYNYGKGDTENLKGFYSGSLKLVFIVTGLSVACGFLLIRPLLVIYGIEGGTEIYELALFGFRLYVIGTILMAYNTFVSVLFISLNNGALPAALSFFRTFVFLVIAYFTLPMFFGLLGAWISMPIAELLAAGMSIYYVRKKRKEYGYA